jgi:gluconokinase
MEAVALRFYLVHEMLRAAAPRAKDVVASGGALLKSPAWTRILADVLGRDIVPSAEPEASSRGAALLTLEALGLIPTLEEPPASFDAPIPADRDRHARYQAALRRQKDHYDKLVRS